MSQKKLIAVILGAGKGTRMKSSLPKVLHEIGGLSMLGHVMQLCDNVGVSQKVIVTGHLSEKVTEAALHNDKAAKIVLQEPQNGTAHAVLQANDYLQNSDGDAVVLYADTPLIQADTIRQMQDIRGSGFDMVFLGFQSINPSGYGRLITDETGELLEIVEAKDATPEQLAVNLCNSGVLMMNAGLLAGLLPQIDNKNAKGEYYLTDIVKLGRKMGLRAGIGLCSEDEVIGVNARTELSHAELIFQTQKRIEMMENGVTLLMPQTVYFSYDTQIESDTVIEPNVYFGKNVKIGKNCTIKGFSHLEGATLGDNVTIGPFARLRTGTMLDDDVKIGNFVEIKKSVIEAGAKVNHLSYIGDASVGMRANIGAGTITCNYDGYDKHKTFIEADAFVGSNSSLVAPVTVGRGAYIGSGSVITKNVDAGSLALSRTPQKEITGWSEQLKRKKRG